MRVSRTPPARRPTSAAAAEAKAPTGNRGRGRPPKAATRKPAGREPNAPSLGERVLALATGKTRQELYVACPTVAVLGQLNPVAEGRASDRAEARLLAKAAVAGHFAERAERSGDGSARDG
jgi:hypothetical protein